MKALSFNLYVKIILWMLLNLLLLALLGTAAGYYAVMGNGKGVFPAALFSSRSDRALRLIGANLQYHPVWEWGEMLESHARHLPVKIHMRTLDTESIQDADIPGRMVRLAAELPRATYTFCPDPTEMFWDSLGGPLFAERGSGPYGLPPVPPVLFIHTGDPSRYWLGRMMYVPDHNSQIHTMLIVMESDTLDGHGLFFDFRMAGLLVLGILGVSFLWWLPFVRHLSLPLRRMARYAEEVEANKLVPAETSPLSGPEFNGSRKDEIGRLGHALLSMTRRISLLMTGQSQFIRYVAHELNTPLAKAQMGLGVLECRLEGSDRDRVQQVMLHIRRLSKLTEEVLTYLQTRASLAAPQPAPVDLCPFLASLAQSEGGGADIHVDVKPGLFLYTDEDYLRRSVGNLLSNALRYAGDAGPVIIRAESSESGEVRVSVSDVGPGVPDEDLPSLCEPFFRGNVALTHPGGTGLGLAIVKHCTEACGGRVEYGNRNPRGFEVRLIFPSRRADA